MKKEDLKKLFENEEFLSALNKVDSMESLQKLLSEKEIKLTAAEILKELTPNEELSIEQLEDISGGNFKENLKKLIRFYIEYQLKKKNKFLGGI